MVGGGQRGKKNCLPPHAEKISDRLCLYECVLRKCGILRTTNKYQNVLKTPLRGRVDDNS